MSQEYRQHSFKRPPGATEILLVRHGESRAASEDNPFPLVDGQGDPELHPNGWEQARRVGERLKSEPIDAVYVTNLRRTHETAEPLCKHLNINPIVEPDLREVHLGEWEGGLLRMKAAQEDPIYHQMRIQQRWDVIPGAEGWDAVNKRVSAGLARIKAAHPDQLVVAVVHGGIVAHILAHASGARAFAFQGADNGSISHIVLMDDQIIVRRFNDVSHLLGTLHDGSGGMT
ncbi:MAG: histidine phosphatase family protein [Pseudomonadaceae bacterium]|nr:histidine phosphatase family protein [Pseudomonadaceae bacterium]